MIRGQIKIALSSQQTNHLIKILGILHITKKLVLKLMGKHPKNTELLKNPK